MTEFKKYNKLTTSDKLISLILKNVKEIENLDGSFEPSREDMLGLHLCPKTIYYNLKELISSSDYKSKPIDWIKYEYLLNNIDYSINSINLIELAYRSNAYEKSDRRKEVLSICSNLKIRLHLLSVLLELSNASQIDDIDSPLDNDTEGLA